MRWGWAAVAAAGLVIVGLSIAAARRPTIPGWEQRVFHAVNGLPAWLYWPLWLPMQFGNLVVGALAGLAVAGWAHRLDVAVGVVVATVLKLVTERLVRHRMASWLTVRQRPGTSEEGAVLRGDVPASGPSFPSGHVILVAAIACLIAPLVPAAVSWVPFVIAMSVMVGRVYVGAHNPLDVTAGLGCGLLLGGLVTAIIA
jgi:membrane-associated phospholipid phosphatase